MVDYIPNSWRMSRLHTPRGTEKEKGKKNRGERGGIKAYITSSKLLSLSY